MSQRYAFLAILLFVSSQHVLAGGLKKFFSDVASAVNTVESTADGCPTFKFELKKDEPRFSINDSGLRLKRCMDFVNEPLNFRDIRIATANDITIKNIDEVSGTLFFGKPISQVDTNDFCAVESFANACQPILDRRSASFHRDTIGRINDAKKRKEQIDKAAQRLAPEISNMKNMLASWSEEECAKLNIPKTLNIKDSQLGSVCGLSQELLSTVISEAQITAGPSNRISVLGMPVRDGIIELMNYARNSYTTGSIGIIAAQIKTGTDNKTSEIQIGIDPQGDDIKKDVYVDVISRTFCGADPTNSLSESSSFNKSLTEKYGAPRAQVTGAEMVRRLSSERDGKLAAMDKISPPQGQEFLHNEIRANLQLGYQFGIEYYQKMNNQVAMLEWQDASGAKLTITDTPGTCAPNRLFKMVLVSNNGKVWLEHVQKSQEKKNNQHSTNAAVPSL